MGSAAPLNSAGRGPAHPPILKKKAHKPSSWGLGHTRGNEYIVRVSPKSRSKIFQKEKRQQILLKRAAFHWDGADRLAQPKGCPDNRKLGTGVGKLSRMGRGGVRKAIARRGGGHFVRALNPFGSQPDPVGTLMKNPQEQQEALDHSKPREASHKQVARTHTNASNWKEKTRQSVPHHPWALRLFAHKQERWKGAVQRDVTSTGLRRYGDGFVCM